MSLRSHPDVTPSSAHIEKVGSYELINQLASGELTAIHSAQRSVARADAAPSQSDAQPAFVVKRLRQHHLHDPESRALLLDSGRVALGVQSPFFARVLEVNEQPEPFLVVERVQGVRLSQLLEAAPGALVPRLALPVLVDALFGLHALHTFCSDGTSPLVHGAPHARHVLVGTDGRGRLIDLTHATGAGLTWSPRHDQRLHPTEMAPEQALAPSCVDARCDLFIVGTVLWRALAGRPLFDAKTHEAAMQRMLHESIVPPSSVGTLWSKGLERVCLRALERARSKRYASAVEMAEALREQAEQADCFAAPSEIEAFVRELRSKGPTRPQEASPSVSRTTLVGVGKPESPTPSQQPVRMASARPRRVKVAQLDTPEPARAADVSASEQSVAEQEREPAEAAQSPRAEVAPQICAETMAAGEPALEPRARLEPQRPSVMRDWQQPRRSLPPARKTLAGTLLKSAVFVLALSMPAALLLDLSDDRAAGPREPSPDQQGRAAQPSAAGAEAAEEEATVALPEDAKSAALSLRREQRTAPPGASDTAPVDESAEVGRAAARSSLSDAHVPETSPAKKREARPARRKLEPAKHGTKHGRLSAEREEPAELPILTTPERPRGEALPINPY